MVVVDVLGSHTRITPQSHRVDTKVNCENHIMCTTAVTRGIVEYVGHSPSFLLVKVMERNDTFLFGIDVHPKDESKQLSVHALVAENRELKVRVQELEACVAEESVVHGRIRRPNACIELFIQAMHNPNSIEHFEGFSVVVKS